MVCLRVFPTMWVSELSSFIEEYSVIKSMVWRLLVTMCVAYRVTSYESLIVWRSIHLYDNP